jgi:hypothetical protein
MLRACIQAFALLPANMVVGFFLGTLQALSTTHLYVGIILASCVIIGSVLTPASIAYQNDWMVFLGTCTVGSVLCKSVWKILVRVEGVAAFLIGVVVWVPSPSSSSCLSLSLATNVHSYRILTLADLVASVRMYHKQRTAFKKLVVVTTAKRHSSHPLQNIPTSPPSR